MDGSDSEHYAPTPGLELTLRRLEGTWITSWQSLTSGVHTFTQSLSQRRSSGCLTTTTWTTVKDAAGDCGVACTGRDWQREIVKESKRLGW